jgi:hypothetical protein
MTDQINFNDEPQKPSLSGGLNVLTILTFIGSGIQILSGLWQFFTAEKSYKSLQEAQGNLDAMPGWAKSMMGPEMLEIARKTAENKLPLLLLNLVGAALCIYGAMEMRKLKKQGFMLWLTGEFLPLFAGAIFVGAGMFKGFGIIGMVFPIVFLILYGVQRKNLIH